MSKKVIVFVSILLVIASILIHVLLKDSNTKLDEELIGFFTGICFGAGIMLPLSLVIKKVKN